MGRDRLNVEEKAIDTKKGIGHGKADPLVSVDKSMIVRRDSIRAAASSARLL